MERPDLGPEYGGWQVIDSTPQETSQGKFCCGPASLRAVKEGELEKPYDAAYVFAEVNADEVLWKYSGESQPLKPTTWDTAYVGQYISTKAVGQMEREDITDAYKYREGTGEERITMEKALRKSESILARNYLNKAFNDVTCTFDLQDDIKIGQNFNVVLHIKNRSSAVSHQVKCVLSVETVTSRDPSLTGNFVKKEEFDLKMEPEGKDVIKMLVTFDDYYMKLVDQGSFKITCQTTIVDTNLDFIVQDNFRVRKPEIKITIDSPPMSGQQFSGSLKVENPLPIPLTESKFDIQVLGLEEQFESQLNESVAPGEFASARFQLKSPLSGIHQILAVFTSKEMKYVFEIHTFMVAKVL